MRLIFGSNGWKDAAGEIIGEAKNGRETKTMALKKSSSRQCDIKTKGKNRNEKIIKTKTRSDVYSSLCYQLLPLPRRNGEADNDESKCGRGQLCCGIHCLRFTNTSESASGLSSVSFYKISSVILFPSHGFLVIL